MVAWSGWASVAEQTVNPRVGQRNLQAVSQNVLFKQIKSRHYPSPPLPAWLWCLPRDK